MKRTNHFIPPQDGRPGPWAANYNEKIALLGQGIGLTAEQIAIQQTAAQSVVNKLNRVEKKSELAEAAYNGSLICHTIELPWKFDLPASDIHGETGSEYIQLKNRLTAAIS